MWPSPSIKLSTMGWYWWVISTTRCGGEGPAAGAQLVDVWRGCALPIATTAW
jgi:hypothetical protein